MTPPQVFDRRSLLLSVLMIVIMVVLAGGMAAYVLSDPGIRDAHLLLRTAYALTESYPESFDVDRVIENARAEMFDQLDRYSYYMSESQVDLMDEELSGGYAGIGVTIVPHESGLLILSVKEDGPADSAGLLPGDIVVQADSVRLDTLGSQRASFRLRGESGSKVHLQIWRKALNDTLNIAVLRSRIEFEHVVYAGRYDEDVVYVRLRDFEAGAGREFEAALDTLLTRAEALSGIIIDLRGNGGGLFSEALDIAEQFLPPDAFIVGTDGRSRWDDREFHAHNDNPADNIPIAVLVDRGTASASEIVAGALRYNDRAILVGDTTYGKGLVQGHYRYMDGDGVRLTISRYYFEGGVYLNEFDSALNEIGRGLTPDFYHATDDIGGFLSELEQSFLLLQFAAANAGDIAASLRNNEIDDAWLDVFGRFCRDEGFSYTSQATHDAAFLKEVAELEKAPSGVLTQSESVLALSRRLDTEQYILNREYVKRRLAEIAVQTKHGSREAHHRVIVPQDEMIQTAAELLRSRLKKVG